MRLSARRKRRFFQVKRGSKLFIPLPKHQIVIPFRKISVILILFLSLLCIYLAFRSDLFLVHSIEEKTEKGGLAIFALEKKNALDFIEDQVKGKSIFFLNQKALKEKILKEFLSISDISFEKDFPNKLYVETFPREPVAALKFVKEASLSGRVASDSARIATSSAFDQQFFLVDKEGLVFVKVSTFSGLPLFYLFDEKFPGLGENIGQKRIQTALEVAQLLKEARIEIKEVFLTSFGTIEMSLKEGPRVLFSSQKSPVAQVTSLQLILSSSRMEGEIPKTIDLRFERPVVRY